MMDDDERRPPTGGIPERFAALGAAAVSMIPVFGGPASIAIQQLVAPVINARREEWFADLWERIRLLEERLGALPEELSTSELFADAVIQATRAALSTSVEEKRSALRNAVLNVAAGQTPSAEVQSVLLRFVEDLTPAHLRILQIVKKKGRRSDLVRSSADEARPLSDYIARDVPELADHRALVDFLCRELGQMGLLDDRGRPGGLGPEPIAIQDLTPLGDQLLRFISDPLGPGP